MNAHAPVKSDSSWQRLLRATQSTWREAKGFEPATLEVGGKERALGSRLTEGDAEAGRNFLTELTWRRVQAELEANEAASGSDRRVLQPARLKSNLLSSQPLCFNVFAELDEDRALATRALRLLWPREIGQVTKIEFEWSPGRGDDTFLGNNTAFDVAIFHDTPAGDKAVTGIEVKYHEDLKGTAGDLRDRAREVAEAALPIDLEDPVWHQGPLNQLLLDHLLALAIDQHPERPYGSTRFCLLYPVANLACQAAIADYHRRLGRAVFDTCTLEAMVGALGACTDASWVSHLRDRYLDYGRGFAVGQGLDRPPRPTAASGTAEHGR